MNNIITEEQIYELVNIYTRFEKYVRAPPKSEGNWVINAENKNNKDALFSSVVFSILSIQEDFSKLRNVHRELYQKYGDENEGILHFEKCKNMRESFAEDLKRLFEENRIGKWDKKLKWIVSSIDSIDRLANEIIDNIISENYCEAIELIKRINGLDTKSWFVLQRLNCKVFSVDSHIKNQLKKIGISDVSKIATSPKEWMKLVGAVRQRFEFEMMGETWNNYAALDLILWYKDKIENFREKLDPEAYPILRNIFGE